MRQRSTKSSTRTCRRSLSVARRRRVWQRRRRRLVGHDVRLLRRPPKPAPRRHRRPRRPRRPPETPRQPRHRWPRPSPPPEAFTVPTDNCPADTTQALADGAPVKIGFIGPQTGPLAAFGVIGQGMKVYFDKINTEEGGVDGHQIELITKDDAYDPAKSAPAVQEALEGDKIFASVFQIGTPNVAGTRQLHADACVPQALVGTGFPAWGDPAELPVDNRRHPVVHRRGQGLGGVHQGEVPRREEGRDPVVQQRLRQDVQDDARRGAARRRIRDRRRRRPRGDIGPVQRGHPTAGRRTRCHHRRNDVDVLHEPDDTGPPGWLHGTDHQLVHLPVDPAVHGAGG